MTARSFTESVVEEAALARLEALGFAVLHGPDIAMGISGAERSEPNYRDVVLEDRLCQTLVGLNPNLPLAALRDTRLPKLISSNLCVSEAGRFMEAARI